MRTYASVAFTLLFLAACDGGESDGDGGRDVDGGSRDAGAQCVTDLDCADERFCTEHRCRAGVVGADSRGCVQIEGPCGSGEACDEDTSSCNAIDCERAPDADGDGHDDLACGGDDCDDRDPLRFPGNAEVCDPVGRDEDCDPATLAGDTDGDRDGDGFVSTVCCNGDSCGDDCADDDRAVFPGARESCNDLDDDCDGSIDEESTTPICPGGVCASGRCDLQPWARTFGDAVNDVINGAAMDDLGNIYVAGYFVRHVDFGGADGPVSSVENTEFGAYTPDAFIASYGADGRYRWVRTIGTEAVGETALGVAFDPSSRQIYVIVDALGAIDLGSGEQEGDALLALGTDGATAWDLRPQAGDCLMRFEAVAGRDGPLLVGQYRGTCTVAGETRTSANFQMFLTQFSATGEVRWGRVTQGSGGVSIRAADVAGGGAVTVSGGYHGDVDFGGGTRTSTGSLDVFVLRVSDEGEYAWDYVGGGAASDTAYDAVVDPAGRTFVVGDFAADADFGGGVVPTATRTSFLVTLDVSGGFERFSTFGAGLPRGLALDSRGNLLVAGSFAGAVNFGGGLASAPAAGAGFLAVFDSELNHRYDRVFTYPGFPALESCAGGECSSVANEIVVGAADSTVVVGGFTGHIELGPVTRSSAGMADAFIYRLGN